MQLVRHEPGTHPISALHDPAPAAPPAGGLVVPGFFRMGTGIAVSEAKSRNGVAWKDSMLAPGTKASALKGCAFFIYLTLRDVRGKA